MKNELNLSIQTSKKHILFVTHILIPFFFLHTVRICPRCQILPQDKNSSLIDQGEHILHLKLTIGKGMMSNSANKGMKYDMMEKCV